MIPRSLAPVQTRGAQQFNGPPMGLEDTLDIGLSQQNQSHDLEVGKQRKNSYL